MDGVRTGNGNVVEVLERVLDKGIVIDAWVRVSVIGIDLITIDTRVVVASLDTYLSYAERLHATPAVARAPRGRPGRARPRNRSSEEDPVKRTFTTLWPSPGW